MIQTAIGLTTRLRRRQLLGQTSTIDNRTGGNALVAAGVVLGAPKDGYSFI